MNAPSKELLRGHEGAIENHRPIWSDVMERTIPDDFDDSSVFPFIQQVVAKQIYSIDVYKDNYLPPFFNQLIRLPPNCFLLLGCVNFTTSLIDFYRSLFLYLYYL